MCSVTYSKFCKVIGGQFFMLFVKRDTYSETRCRNLKQPNFPIVVKKSTQVLNLNVPRFQDCPQNHQIFGLLFKENLWPRYFKKSPNLVALDTQHVLFLSRSRGERLLHAQRDFTTLREWCRQVVKCRITLWRTLKES